MPELWVPDYRIRPMTVESAGSDIAAGFVREFPDAVREALAGKIIAGEVTMLVAEKVDDGSPMGHVGIGWGGAENPDIRSISGERVHLAFLGVPKDYRFGGIGTNLMRNAIEIAWANERGRQHGIGLAVAVGNPSERMYRRLGFGALADPVESRGMPQRVMALNEGDWEVSATSVILDRNDTESDS